MSKKQHPTDKDYFIFSKNKYKNKIQNTSTKKTNDCRGFTEKSRKMVILFYY